MRIAFTLLVLVLAPGVFAHGDALNHGEELATQGIECEELDAGQLAAVGEYVMEQMHPGEAHERMDAMMTGGDPERSQSVHVAVAQQHYCGREALYRAVDDCSVAGGCSMTPEPQSSQPVGTWLVGAGVLVLGATSALWWRGKQ